MKSSTVIFSIDGNIGSGKSRLVSDLEEFYRDRDDIYFAPEPVEEWHSVVDKDGIPILTNLYKDPKKYAFRFQMMAYISRLKLLKDAINNKKYKIIITERSVLTDRNVFAKMLYDDGKIEEDEYTIYNKWFYAFLDDVDVAGLIYVRASPDTCLQRVLKRNREGEIIAIDYLKNCHTYHENWINSETCAKYVIDADVNIDDNEQTRLKWLQKVDTFINEQTKQDTYTLYFDGGCRNNPSKSYGAGAVIYKNGKEVWKDCIYEQLEHATCNIAEYQGLIIGLQGAIDMNIKDISVKGDSKLIINQVMGNYQVKAEHLKMYHENVTNLLKNFDNFTLEHVKRINNQRADELANMAMDTKEALEAN